MNNRIPLIFMFFAFLMPIYSNDAQEELAGRKKIFSILYKNNPKLKNLAGPSAEIGRASCRERV